MASLDFIVSNLAIDKTLPISMIQAELSNTFLSDIQDILAYYDVYENGIKVATEGSLGDYIPSSDESKLVRILINKQARFLFGEPPDINIQAMLIENTDTDEIKNSVELLNNYITNILSKNKWETNLIKSAKDCFIGKRIAILINFDKRGKIQLSFLPAMNFSYEYDYASDELIEFKSYTFEYEDENTKGSIFLMKHYQKTNEGILLTEALVNSTGKIIQSISEEQQIKLNEIPVVVIENDNLLSDKGGISEVADIMSFEKRYSLLDNQDADALRKGMNPTKYTIDANPATTKKLSTGPGAYWDLQTNQNNDEGSGARVGILESNMSYSKALETTINRVKNAAYEMLEIPNINDEMLKGTITSGKSLAALYWPLTVRCQEKMKTWGPAIIKVIDILIDGGLTYPKIASNYTNGEDLPSISYKVNIDMNYPIPSDANEEKTIDASDVLGDRMSRKTYMKKWYSLTDTQADEELRQIALEKAVLEDGAVLPPQNQSARIDLSTAQDRDKQVEVEIIE